MLYKFAKFKRKELIIVPLKCEVTTLSNIQNKNWLIISHFLILKMTDAIP